jgi:putative endonuclease
LRRTKSYYVYILTNRYGTLYTGVTNDLERRMYEHKQRSIPGFAAKYNITRLLHYEEANDVWTAIEREKEIKAWRRSKKAALIDSENPLWKDLSEDWFGKA